jgi:hypothetical protein
MTHEPPPSSPVPERPCAVILAEDLSLYSKSWHDEFLGELPQHRGLEYGYLGMNGTTLDERLDNLKQELAFIPSVVFVSRGPLVSWTALYYLESLPLAGLIMIDPIAYDELDEVMEQEKNIQGEKHVTLRSAEIDSLNETRPLKLEPGPVPMLVIQSLEDHLYEVMARRVASRHGGETSSIFGEVQVMAIDTSGDAIDRICNWIDDSVL